MGLAQGLDLVRVTRLVALLRAEEEVLRVLVEASRGVVLPRRLRTAVRKTTITHWPESAATEPYAVLLFEFRADEFAKLLCGETLSFWIRFGRLRHTETKIDTHSDTIRTQ